MELNAKNFALLVEFKLTLGVFGQEHVSRRLRSRGNTLGG